MQACRTSGWLFDESLFRRSLEHMSGQTPANVQSILRLANNMAVAKHLQHEAPRAVTVEHVAAAAAEIYGGRNHAD